MTSNRASCWAYRLALLIIFPGFQHLILNQAWGTVIAADNVSDVAYGAETGGAWKGLYPTADENPPGMDNGGSGFDAWDFYGGFHQPQYSPYGRLNHFIAGDDFATTSFNNLGSQAFALTNSNFYPPACGTLCAFGGETARATRSFVSPLVPGDTFSIEFDNPLMSPEVAWYPAGFLMRLNTGHGPVIPDHPTSTATERFGIFAATGVFGGPGLFDSNWAVADLAGNTDTDIDVSTTASGAELQFTLSTDETYALELRRRSDGALLFSRTGSLSATGAGAIDTIEIALYGNGSGNGQAGATMQPTGEREFYFNDLLIKRAANMAGQPGDYNNNGVVDAADYVLWRDYEGTTNVLANDPIGGTIGQLQYNQWLAHFDQSAAAGTGADANAPVPEPTSFLLMALADFWWLRRGRAR
jgi:hypothetical protein